MQPSRSRRAGLSLRLRSKVRAARLATTLNYRLERLGMGRIRGWNRASEAVNRLAEKGLSDGSRVLTDDHGMPLYVNRGTFETGAYLRRPYEPATTKVFMRSMRTGGRVIDVGAQFGYFTLIAARIAGRSGHVWALEPVSDNAELLKMNVSLNGFTETVEIVEKAAGESTQTLKMFVYEGSDSHALHRCPDASVREEVDVETVPIDELTEGQGVDLIKIDVEGHEPYAIEGMRKTIEASPRLVMIAEYAPAYLERAGADPSEYLDQIRDLGFEISVIYEETGRVGPFTKAAREGLGSRPNVNLYCVKRP